MNDEEFDLLMRRAGLELSPQDAEQVKSLFEKYSERLAILNAADLDDEEVAGVFLPQWNPEQ